MTNNPHGGKLINRIVSNEEFKIFKENKYNLKTINLNRRELSDVEMISIGGFSPLEGFMCQNDYISVIDNMRLSNGLIWTIPITLSTTSEEADKFDLGDKILLLDEKGEEVAILFLEEKFKYDKDLEAEKVYKTKDKEHPGVRTLYSQGEVLLGGKINVVERNSHNSFYKYYLTPEETRKLFKEKGWKTIVGFQTRNPIHRAHEYIQKCALEICDGLFIHPIVGETKSDDVPAEVRMKCYEVLIENYYPKDRVVLAINPAYMRYAGPREAIFHAIVRKNYGCTHFIVGRDHAGVGNYYGPYDAQKIFYEFNPEELGIVPLFFENTFYCKRCGNMASSKTCPHKEEDRIVLSGTKVRQMLQEEEMPPIEFTRPEIAKILIEATKKKRTDYNI